MTLDGIISAIGEINNVIWHDTVLYVVVGVGVLFTIWTAFCQRRALTHGVAVTLGRYDDKNDPGAINHFQALSAALSATVGLGNIGGVALAITLGGPGAVFYMWLIGLLGMAIKTTEVTLSMLYRNTDDPDNPHGGPMFVARQAFADWGLRPLGSLVGGVFCVTLLVSAITGGNMFQSWNVADITFAYWGVPQIATGIILCVLVGLVIIGGIKRIGNVAGRLVPAMCILYILAALYVLIVNYHHIPGVFKLIFTAAFNPLEAQGAFIGGTAGYAFLWGMKRALFSSESGQGSSPIAHSAAKTNEPVREAVVAGLEPFIDTIVVCTLTALVILSSGVWNRDPDAKFLDMPSIVPAQEDGRPVDGKWVLDTTTPPVWNDADESWSVDENFQVIVRAGENEDTGNDLHTITGVIVERDGRQVVEWTPFESQQKPELLNAGVYANYQGATLTGKAFDVTTNGLGAYLVTLAAWLFAISTMISWSYYGEQGMIYLFGEKSVLPYKVVYCLLIVVAALPNLVKTDTELDALTSLGTGVMLWANIPIMLVFGGIAMKAYHTYMRKLDAGEFHPHAQPKLTDVIEGKDVE
ncbi:MAG: alanine:cation symporter family protein [Planctomycetota bacterium]|nr:MAG: alanine:cation symporter family protein [Planctomycetota bacterium]